MGSLCFVVSNIYWIVQLYHCFIIFLRDGVFGFSQVMHVLSFLNERDYAVSLTTRGVWRIIALYFGSEWIVGVFWPVRYRQWNLKRNCFRNNSQTPTKKFAIALRHEPTLCLGCIFESWNYETSDLLCFMSQISLKPGLRRPGRFEFDKKTIALALRTCDLIENYSVLSKSKK